MPRPKLVDYRKQQILDAFARSIVQHGIGGTTLEKIAESAGMRRSILRHYVGNRGDLIEEMANRILDRFDRRIDELKSIETGSNPVEELLEWLIPVESAQSQEEFTIFDALVSEAGRHPNLDRLIRRHLERMLDGMTRTIAEVFAGATNGQCRDAAVSLAALSYAFHQWTPLQLNQDDSLRRTAESILASLAAPRKPRLRPVVAKREESEPPRAFQEESEIGIND